MKKSSVLPTLLELALGAVAIVVGVFKPPIIWQRSFMTSIKGSLGDTVFGILLIAGGGLLILWSLFQLVQRLRTSEDPPAS
jgi:hypothetical protein